MGVPKISGSSTGGGTCPDGTHSAILAAFQYTTPQGTYGVHTAGPHFEKAEKCRSSSVSPQSGNEEHAGISEEVLVCF